MWRIVEGSSKTNSLDDTKRSSTSGRSRARLKTHLMCTIKPITGTFKPIQIFNIGRIARPQLLAGESFSPAKGKEMAPQPTIVA